MADLINKWETMRALQTINPVAKLMDGDIVIRISEVENVLEHMTPAQPETAKRIVGKSRDGMTLWYQCDTCNEPVDAQDNYCRGCGRRLIDSVRWNCPLWEGGDGE